MYENTKLRIENLIWMSYQILQRSCKVSWVLSQMDNLLVYTVWKQ